MLSLEYKYDGVLCCGSVLWHAGYSRACACEGVMFWCHKYSSDQVFKQSSRKGCYVLLCAATHVCDLRTCRMKTLLIWVTSALS